MDTIKLSNKLLQLELYPFFDLSHMIICCLHIRSDLAQTTEGIYFSRRHPFACWLSCIFTIYSGTILANFLLNEPIIQVFNDTTHVILSSIVWYLIFHSPLDVVYKLCTFTPVISILTIMKEILRCHKVRAGVILATKLHPGSYFTIIVIGTVKGNGYGFLRVIERVFRGIWKPNDNEFLNLSLATKVSIMGSIALILEEKTFMSKEMHCLVFGIITTITLILKLWPITSSNENIKGVEVIICDFLFGRSSNKMKPSSISTKKPDTKVEVVKNFLRRKNRSDKNKLQ